MGKILADWILAEGRAPLEQDVTHMRVNRFHSYQNNPQYRKERVVESLGNTYKVPYPDRQLKTCRGCMKSPLHDRLETQGALFRDVSGWESPAWYVTSDSHNENGNPNALTFGRGPAFQFWESEHKACRESVALFDMSFMSKFLVQGRDAGNFLNRLSTAEVDGESNRITYTQWLNEDGYMEADLTITKLADDQFLVVATDTMQHHVHSHMLQRLSVDQHCFVTDMTGRYAQLNIQGPRSRELMQTLTLQDMSNFEFRRAQEIDVGLARVLCTRITYVGELGYELFIPVEQATLVYDFIVAKGADFGLQHAGLRALGSLRLEKGYRDYGHDMDNTDTLIECGLSFTCDFNKKDGFIGQEQVLQQREDSIRRGGMLKRMVNVMVNDPVPMMHHGEILWRNNERISDIRVASFGHSIGGTVGLAMLENQEPVTKSWIDDGDWVVEIAEELFPCKVSLKPFYDPNNLRIKM